MLGGGRIGYRLDASYSQKEQLADNIRQGTFENGRRVRNESSGLLPDVSRLDVAIEAGASYEIPLNGSRTMLAAPELMLSYGVTPVVSSLSWSAHALRAGIALKYAPSADTAPRPPVVIPSPPPRVLAARIVAVGVDADGTEERAVRLRVEEFISTDVHRLLGYVFFARGSSELDRRYDILKTKYQQMLSRKVEAEVAADQELRARSQTFHVLAAAVLPPAPARPDRHAGMMMVTLAALALALLAGVVLELQDDSLREPADAHHALQLPVLAVVPDLGRKTLFGTGKTLRPAVNRSTFDA